MRQFSKHFKMFGSGSEIGSENIIRIQPNSLNPDLQYGTGIILVFLARLALALFKIVIFLVGFYLVLVTVIVLMNWVGNNYKPHK